MLSRDTFEPTLVGSIRKYWWVVVGATVACVALALVVQATIANDWVAESSMLVENPESSRLFDQETGISAERYTANQVATLESTDISARAAEIAERQTDASLRVEDIESDVEIESTMDDGLIEIIVTREDPQQAVAIANAMLDAYQEHSEREGSRGVEAVLTELDASLADLDEELAAIEAEIASLRSPNEEGGALDDRIDTAMGQIADVLLQQEALSAAQRESLVEQLEALQLLRALQVEDPSIASLAMAREQALERRSQLATRRDQLEIDAALTSTGIAAVSPARAASESVSPDRAGAIGLLAGVIIGSALALSLANRSQRFTHRAEPELVLDAHLLAEVPDFGTERISSKLPIQDAPRSAAAEAFRFAAAAVASRSAIRSPGADGAESGARVVAIVSSLLGEGKSVVAANLAIAAAAKGRNVLIIDCDFGDPSLSEIMRAPTTTTGITDVVDASSSLDEAVQPIDIGNGLSVNLLPRGSQTVAAPAFFRAPDTERFFESIRSRYDLILVDLPPMLQVAYAGSVLRLCDKAMVVVPHRSEVAPLVETVDRISLAGSGILGYVYNRSPLRREMKSTEGSMSDPLGLGPGGSFNSQLLEGDLSES